MVSYRIKKLNYTSYQINKINYGLDSFKFVCAFLIVFMHTYKKDLGIYGDWFNSVITPIGVPFFFIVSGYFYSKGLLRNDDKWAYYRRYVIRLIMMYVAWSIITLPVTWLCIERGHPDYSILMKIVYLFRMIFFVGSCGIYWYILALICCSTIMYVCIKRGWIHSLYLLSFLFYLVGVWYNSPYNNGNFILKSIHVIFSSERNFINVGLFYMCIGHFFANKIFKANIKITSIILLISILLRTFEVNYLHTNSLQALIAIALFVFALNLNVTIKDETSLKVPKLSTAMYLLHFPFILLFDFYLRRGTLVDFPVTLLFCFITFYILDRFLSKEWNKVLFG